MLVIYRKQYPINVRVMMALVGLFDEIFDNILAWYRLNFINDASNLVFQKLFLGIGINLSFQ